MKGIHWVLSAFFAIAGVGQIVQPANASVVRSKDFAPLCAKVDTDRGPFRPAGTTKVGENIIKLYALKPDDQLEKSAAAPGQAYDTLIVALIKSGKNNTAEIPRIKVICYATHEDHGVNGDITINTQTNASFRIVLVLDKTVKYSFWKQDKRLSPPLNDAVWLAESSSSDPDPIFWTSCMGEANKQVVADSAMIIHFDMCSPDTTGTVTYKYSLRMDQRDKPEEESDGAKTVVIIDPQIINQVH